MTYIRNTLTTSLTTPMQTQLSFLAKLALFSALGAGAFLTQQSLAQSAEQWDLSAVDKYNNRDFQGAIADWTKSIELNPTDAFVFLQRGRAKSKTWDGHGAVNDFNAAIRINPQYVSAYYQRADTKYYILGDTHGALSDYTKVIELRPDVTAAYRERGLVREGMGNRNGACLDWRKAAALGDIEASRWAREQC